MLELCKFGKGNIQDYNHPRHQIAMHLANINVGDSGSLKWASKHTACWGRAENLLNLLPRLVQATGRARRWLLTAGRAISGTRLQHILVFTGPAVMLPSPKDCGALAPNSSVHAYHDPLILNISFGPLHAKDIVEQVFEPIQSPRNGFDFFTSKTCANMNL